jgi:hypothetical protein
LITSKSAVFAAFLALIRLPLDSRTSPVNAGIGPIASALAVTLFPPATALDTETVGAPVVQRMNFATVTSPELNAFHATPSVDV